MMRALKAAAAIAVLGVLGGGCGSTSNGTLAFAWRFSDNKGVLAGDFTGANNGCSTAYVDNVTVTLDGVDYAGNACAAPANSPTGTPTLDLVGVSARSHPYTVSAYRGSELVFQASGNVASSGATTPVHVTLSPAYTSSSLPIFYTQNGTYSCSNTYYVEYEILDAYGSVLDYANYTTGNALVCDPASPHFLPHYQSAASDIYPFGPYKLHYITLTSSTGAVQFQSCCVALDHEGFAQVVDVLYPPQSCPGTCP